MSKIPGTKQMFLKDFSDDTTEGGYCHFSFDRKRKKHASYQKGSVKGVTLVEALCRPNMT